MAVLLRFGRLLGIDEAVGAIPALHQARTFVFGDPPPPCQDAAEVQLTELEVQLFSSPV